MSQPKAQPSNQGPQLKNNSPGNIKKKWPAQGYPGCPIIQRSSKEVTYNQINTGDQTNIETREPNKYSTPTCIKSVVHTQNNQYTFAQLPHL